MRNTSIMFSVCDFYIISPCYFDSKLAVLSFGSFSNHICRTATQVFPEGDESKETGRGLRFESFRCVVLHLRTHVPVILS